MNILEKADQIVNRRSEEKEREYGPFSEGMEKAAAIASLIANKPISAELIYVALISLKLSRESYCHKEDNLLDLVAYIGALNNYIQEKKMKENNNGKRGSKRQGNKGRMQSQI